MAGVYPAALEIRREGRRTHIGGSFPYKGLATIADRGRVRKERIRPGAFNFAIKDPDREIQFLRGHSFDHPLASKRAGTLDFLDTAAALTFDAAMPPDDEQPSWVSDTLKAIRAGLMLGLSPGFSVPPRTAVPDAEEEEEEEGNPGVFVRILNAVVLHELSAVTLPAYRDAAVDLRAADQLKPIQGRRRWLLTL